jgi:hypothetical protein
MHWTYTGGAPDERQDPANGSFSMDTAFYVARCEPCHFAYDYASGGRPGMRRSA